MNFYDKLGGNIDMVNMSIFKILLECAYDLSIVHFYTDVKEFQSNKNGYRFIHECDINTTDGGLHITLDENHFEEDKYINAAIKTSIKSQSQNDIRELVESQLGVEAFLNCDDYENYSYKCELIK